MLGHAAGGFHPGDAEIGHFDLPVRQQNDVARLDVPMHHAAGVRVVQRVQDLDGHRHRVGQRQRLALLEIIAQLPALHVLHDDVGNPFLFAELEHRDDVGMQAAAGGAHLAAKPLQPFRTVLAFQQGAVNGLDRDLTVDGLVVAEIDHPHGAAAERFGQPVAADMRRTGFADVAAVGGHAVIRPASSWRFPGSGASG